MAKPVGVYGIFREDEMSEDENPWASGLKKEGKVSIHP